MKILLYGIEFPWMAALMNTDESFFCRGTLIASRWLLTAAQCLFKDPSQTIPKTTSEIRIVLGEHDTESATESIIARKVIKVAIIIKHPNYNTITSDSDIAMIKLSAAVDLNMFGYYQGDDLTGKKAWVSG